MALINTQEIVENSIYLALEKVLTREGYLPDMSIYDFENVVNSVAETEYKRYLTDLENIANLKGFAIELFNYDDSQSKGLKKVPRIVIETTGFFPGNIGKDSTAIYSLNNQNKFDKKFDSQKTSDIYINIHLLANSAKQIRILHAVCSEAIPRRGYLPRFIDIDTELVLTQNGNLLIEYIDYNDSSDASQGVIEKVYRYMIPDVVENFPRIDNTNISKIIEIERTINIT